MKKLLSIVAILTSIVAVYEGPSSALAAEDPSITHVLGEAARRAGIVNGAINKETAYFMGLVSDPAVRDLLSQVASDFFGEHPSEMVDGDAVGKCNPEKMKQLMENWIESAIFGDNLKRVFKSITSDFYTSLQIEIKGESRPVLDPSIADLQIAPQVMSSVINILRDTSDPDNVEYAAIINGLEKETSGKNLPFVNDAIRGLKVGLSSNLEENEVLIQLIDDTQNATLREALEATINTPKIAIGELTSLGQRLRFNELHDNRHTNIRPIGSLSDGFWQQKITSVTLFVPDNIFKQGQGAIQEHLAMRREVTMFYMRSLGQVSALNFFSTITPKTALAKDFGTTALTDLIFSWHRINRHGMVTDETFDDALKETLGGEFQEADVESQQNLEPLFIAVRQKMPEYTARIGIEDFLLETPTNALALRILRENNNKINIRTLNMMFNAGLQEERASSVDMFVYLEWLHSIVAEAPTAESSVSGI